MGDQFQHESFHFQEEPNFSRFYHHHGYGGNNSFSRSNIPDRARQKSDSGKNNSQRRNSDHNPFHRRNSDHNASPRRNSDYNPFHPQGNYRPFGNFPYREEYDSDDDCIIS